MTSGERLSDSSDFEVALEMCAINRRPRPRSGSRDPGVPVPVLRRDARAHSGHVFDVAGRVQRRRRKQARSLEPLLVTPITTLRVARRQGAGRVHSVDRADRGQLRGLRAGHGSFLRDRASPRACWGRVSIAIVFVLGPLAALAALQMAVCVSSRVNDAGTAQQIGVLVILPIPGLLVGQLFGAVTLTVPVIARDRPRPRRHQRRPDVARDHALRSRDDSDPMEVERAWALGLREASTMVIESSRDVLVKHVREAFVDEPTIAAQWKALNYTAPPDLPRAIDEHDRFIDILRSTRRDVPSAASRPADDARLDLRSRRLDRLAVRG